MVKSLIKVGLLLVGGILVYNYFFGTPEEKAQSKEIFTNVKDLTKSAVDLLKQEKQKFDDGKYDEAVDKIGGLLENLKGKAEQLEDNRDLLEQIDELERKRQRLSEEINQEVPESYDNTSGERPEMDQTSRKEIEEKWEDLVRKTENLMDDMEKKGQ
ncbi:MAG: hypothetical protein HRU12_21830 [Phaeodactylibacter sp.]|nr:hypothetical protein [Phaeodactylibacter sp.]